MTSAHSVSVTRPDAFSSFAVTVVMAALAILALAFGEVQDSKAESEAGMARTVAMAKQP